MYTYEQCSHQDSTAEGYIKFILPIISYALRLMTEISLLKQLSKGHIWLLWYWPKGTVPFGEPLPRTVLMSHACGYTFHCKNETVRVTTYVVSPVASPWHCHGISMAMPQGSLLLSFHFYSESLSFGVLFHTVVLSELTDQISCNLAVDVVYLLD